MVSRREWIGLGVALGGVVLMGFLAVGAAGVWWFALRDPAEAASAVSAPAPAARDRPNDRQVESRQISLQLISVMALTSL